MWLPRKSGFGSNDVVYGFGLNGFGIWGLEIEGSEILTFNWVEGIGCEWVLD